MKCLMYCMMIYLVAAVGCKQNNTLFHRLSAGSTGVDFDNQLTGNDSLSVLDFEYKFNGGGVALIDINKDGLEDIVFTGNRVPSKLYLNKGHLKFEDITEKAGFKTSGWCNGVAVVDINQDGYPDIYISKAGPKNTPPTEMNNLFFINNGNNTFTEKAASMGLDDDGYDVQSAFFDYDGDGDLDMYLVRNGFVNYNRNTARDINTKGQAPSTGKLFRNDGNLHFTDVSKVAGITIEGFGLGVAISDINNDNLPDIYVSNDFLTSDLLYLNNGDGTFTNDAKKCLRHESYNGMGNDVSDFNNDGNVDIAVVDMLPPDNRHWKKTMMGNTYDEFTNNLAYGYDCQYVRNTLQLNNGDGTFSEIGQLAGVYQTDWSWSPLFADFDNDGWKDLYISNGYRQDVTDLDFIHYGAMAVAMGTPEAKRKERLEQLKKVEGIKVHNYVFKNNHNLTFTDVSEGWGLTQKGFSNGAVYGDLDNDGDLDVITNNIDEPAAIYENRSSEMHPENAWLRLQFLGPNGNRDGLGTKVWIWQNGAMQYQYFSPYRGYLSTVEQVVHFGVANKNIDSLKVQWPDGKAQILKGIKPKQILALNYKNAIIAAKINASVATALFQPYNDSANIHFQQEEDEFSDFKLQPLLPHMLSHEGPGIAVADVNGDGLEDFFIGNGTDYKSRIFLQNAAGGFNPKALSTDTMPNITDDMGTLFFDADGDGDNDLYLAKGGVAKSTSLPGIYQHKFYVNDGKGNFTPSPESIPVITNSGSSVIAADYDHDGDLDVLVCGRVIPGSYPLSPKSFLLRNDSKNGACKFVDASAVFGLPLTDMGMVTDALWTDFDNDGWVDLLVVGEFMPLRFFKNNHPGFTEITTTGLQNTKGWWNSIAAADFDHDGDIDYMVGNLGLNSGMKASPAEPITVYAADFDKNGRIDPIMTHYVDGTEYMIHARDDINRQINAMRVRFKDYNTYAETAFKDAFTEEEIKAATIVTAQTFASAWVENKGSGKFVLHSLPLEAQLSPIYGMVCSDFNGDGFTDVLCVGNSFATEVNIGRYDAQGGLLLINDGKGNFKADRKSFNIGGDNKSLVLMDNGNRTLALVGTNSGELKAYKINQSNVVNIAAQPQDIYAIITLKNGTTFRQELYWGSSYLSQSSRTIRLSKSIGSIASYSIHGKNKEVKL